MLTQNYQTSFNAKFHVQVQIKGSSNEKSRYFKSLNCACDRSINTRSSLHIKQSKLKKVKISFRYILGRMKWVRSESDRQGKFLPKLTTFFDISAGFLKHRRTSSMPRGRILIISSIISLGGPLYSAIVHCAAAQRSSTPSAQKQRNWNKDTGNEWHKIGYKFIHRRRRITPFNIWQTIVVWI